MTTARQRRMSAPFIAFWLVLAGIERAHSDMGEQSKYLPYSPSEFYSDGASARPLPAGVVARTDEPPASISITADFIQRGQQQFDIYCAVCHGRVGNGEGMIVQRGFVRPPSFHVERL